MRSATKVSTESGSEFHSTVTPKCRHNSYAKRAVRAEEEIVTARVSNAVTYRVIIEA